jgi:hypothetical protein
VEKGEGSAAVHIRKGKAVEGEGSFVVGRGKGSLFALEGGKDSRWWQKERLSEVVEKGEGSAAVRM